MIRWCCYCLSYIGEKEPLEDKSLTHGICEKCLEVELNKRKEVKQDERN